MEIKPFQKPIQTHCNITQKSRKIHFRLVCWLFPFGVYSTFVSDEKLKKKPRKLFDLCLCLYNTRDLCLCFFSYFFYFAGKNKWMYTQISSQAGFASIQFTWGSLCKITQFFETHLCLYHHSNVHPFWMFWLHTAHINIREWIEYLNSTERYKCCIQ